MSSTSGAVAHTSDQLELSKTVGESLYLVLKDIFENVYRWWKNDISGRRCAATVINGVNTTFVSVGFTVAGALTGNLLGPVGAVVGGTVSGLAAKGIIDSSRKGIYELFDLPQSEAAEKAYEYLSVNHNASIQEIKKSYLKLAMVHHPDKGGNDNEFKKLSSCMAIIKADRKDFTYDI